MNQVNQWIRLASVLGTSVFLVSCGGGNDRGPTISGTANPACSPVDGPATHFDFSIMNQQRLVFRLNRSYEQVVGQWKIANPDAADGLSVSLCSVNSYLDCKPIEEGVFVVAKSQDQIITGSWTLKTPYAIPNNADFKANLLSTSRPMCG